jgi:hypothetical protein
MERNKSTKTTNIIYKDSPEKKDNRGGAREGAGRPQLPKKKANNIRKLYRFSPEDYKKITEAVEVSGEKEALFVRTAVMDRVFKYLAYKNSKK